MNVIELNKDHSVHIVLKLSSTGTVGSNASRDMNTYPRRPTVLCCFVLVQALR